MDFPAALHLLLHALVPAAVAWLAFRSRWRRLWLIMLATMLVDLDHLLADPVYAPGRCSILAHPLHQPGASLLYAGMALIPQTMPVGLGLVIHMALDAIDCGRMQPPADQYLSI